MRTRLSFLLTTFALLLLAPACGDTGGTGGGVGGSDAQTGTVIVGVLSDLRVGVDVASIHVVKRAGGAVIEDETLDASSPLKFPAELSFNDLPGGTPIDITLDAYRPGDSATPLVTRRAATEIVAGKKLLLRVAIDSRCVDAPGSNAPSCAAPETCAGGVCVDEHIDASKLKPWSAGWASGMGDVCKPSAGGTPTVFVGEGQGDYLPTMDGDVAQVEAGPQGGHHIWVAARMKNLTQSGSITSVTGHFPDLGLDVGPFDVIFTFEPDEGGYCKLYGLRFQLDQSADIATLLGHPLDVKVKVTDSQGDVGVGARSVVLSKDLLQ